ncbi:hypothetical protein KEM48_012035 [Puccinia striiformis f. sp. tritici PST-130]|uniref:Uncharacterized protein n=2 Tax=Puccinia striiformis TaxID=27350 RepID=A0A0L0VZX5_9BASI|nr:hypothetical protein KEM48_012035 [Puccinia striiformis f. sp. tritici PST-130]KNF04818.1 hypothetical protein PSTG_01875 [Puccinia striiformis f. sp. tritici PST-78]POW01910.1 hypothetical protein PSTT_12158 [Puccinia striiformis]
MAGSTSAWTGPGLRDRQARRRRRDIVAEQSNASHLEAGSIEPSMPGSTVRRKGLPGCTLIPGKVPGTQAKHLVFVPSSDSSPRTSAPTFRPSDSLAGPHSASQHKLLSMISTNWSVRGLHIAFDDLQQLVIERTDPLSMIHSSRPPRGLVKLGRKRPRKICHQQSPFAG